MSAAGMLAEARKSLGLRGRPNYITRDYARRHGDAYLDAAWCDMAITYWARHSGNTAAVLPGGDRAFTVWHAQDFQKAGRWHTGTSAEVDRAKPGDIVFFDWGASNSIGAIDHVGVVEKNLGGGRLQTIEGNTGDACLRRVRSASVIAGYGRPAYDNTVSDEEDDMKPTDSVEVGEYFDAYFSGKHYPAGFLWVGSLAEAKRARQAAERMEAKLDAQAATIDKLVDAVAAGPGVDVEALKAEIREAIESVSVRLDVKEEEPS